MREGKYLNTKIWKQPAQLADGMQDAGCSRRRERERAIWQRMVRCCDSFIFFQPGVYIEQRAEAASLNLAATHQTLKRRKYLGMIGIESTALSLL